MTQTNQPAFNNIIFENHSITVHRINGRDYLSAADISRALGFEKSNAVTQIYHRYKDEFEEENTLSLKLRLSGNITVNTRVFDREGAWTIAMFARTPAAAKFRKWVKKVLAAYVDGQKPVAVSAPAEQPAIEKTAGAQEDVMMNALKAAYNCLFPVMDNLRAYKDLWETRNILIHSAPRQALALNDALDGLYAAMQEDVQSSYATLQDMVVGKKPKPKPSIHDFLERSSARLSRG